MSKPETVSSDCKWFFNDVAMAPKRALLVDYDGTVAPFSINRDRAFPYPAIPELLHKIANRCKTRLIMVSGRSAIGVSSLLGLTPAVEIWGTHGLERLHPDGRYEGAEVADEAFDALVEAEAHLEEEGLEELLEVRPGAVAVHWRGLKASQTLEIRTKAYRILNSLALQAGLLGADFDGGVEIRLRSANTGDMVRTILAEIGPKVPIAYLGDDTSDEEAFRVLNGRGLTVLVRPKYRFTAAQLWLRPPDEIIGFFNDFINAAGGDA